MFNKKSNHILKNIYYYGLIIGLFIGLFIGDSDGVEFPPSDPASPNLITVSPVQYGISTVKVFL